jgi:Animal haem peroxidase
MNAKKAKESVATKLLRPPGHGRVERGLNASVARVAEGFGRFGRLFPELAPARFGDTLQDDEALMRAIADTMIKVDAGGPIDQTEAVDENPAISAGHTYVGQFVDHDITFDTASNLDRDNDPNAVEDFRTARLDLDSVYGRGPTDQPYLYNPDLTFKLGADKTPAYLNPAKRFDVPRAPGDLSGEDHGAECARAIIGDPRNDENTIVVQLHSLWQRAHNKIMAELAQPTATRGPITGKAAFGTAQRQVRWHYQWLVLHDFVRRIVGDKMFHAVYNKGKPDLQFYRPGNARFPFMPVEFSVAAYRFGHSMVRPSYSLSAMVPHQVVPPPDNLNRLPIFALPFTCDDKQSLNGFRPLNDSWGIDWSFFFPNLQTNKPPFNKKPFSDFVRPQPAYRIDTLLVDPLANLPDHQGETKPGRKSLPALNLMRGVALGLPSGQEVARRMGITPLTDKALWLDAGNLTDDAAIERRQKLFNDNLEKLHKNAPLWYYVLREAELANQVVVEFLDDNNNKKKQKLGGSHLGEVGGRIVAEVLIGLVVHDSQSYLVQHPRWLPTIPAAGAPASFEFADIVRYVDS